MSETPGPSQSVASSSEGAVPAASAISRGEAGGPAATGAVTGAGGESAPPVLPTTQEKALGGILGGGSSPAIGEVGSVVGEPQQTLGEPQPSTGEHQQGTGENGSEGGASGGAGDRENQPTGESERRGSESERGDAPEVAEPSEDPEDREDMAMLAEWATEGDISPQDMKIALLALAGDRNKNVFNLAEAYLARRLLGPLYDAKKPDSRKAVPAFVLKSLFGGIATAPFSFLRRKGAERTLAQASTSARRQESIAFGEMQIFKNGTPRMKAILMDAQIASLRASMAETNDSARLEKMEKELGALEKTRGSLKEGGEVVPNQYKLMADKVASATEADGAVPDHYAGDPVGYLQDTLGLALTDNKMRTSFLGKLEDAGILDPDAREELDAMFTISAKSVGENATRYLIDLASTGGIIMMLAIWYKEMQAKQQGARG